MTKSIDVALLRLALRLVHCIQKERGSSLYCSACKGGYSDSRETFEKAMKNARHDVDKVISSWLHQQEISSIRSSLVKIRSLIDSQDESDDELIFHRIFACFNILNSSIVSDFIIPQVPGKYHKSIIQKQHKRNSLSMDLHNTLSTLAVPTPDSISTPEHSNPSVHSESSPASFSLESQHLQLGLDSTLQDLLNLLHIFVQLKESAGIERAILSTLLVFQTRRNNSVRHFLNDLVLQVENQRSLVHQLEQLPPGQHRNLVLELTKLSPRLQQLQTVILNDFEALQKQKYDSEALWGLLTEYIDKLHSVELLIIEDLEISLPTLSHSSVAALLPPSAIPISEQQQSSHQSASTNLVKELRLALYSSAQKGDFVSQIESMSANEVKACLLEAIGGDKEANNGKLELEPQQQDSKAKNLNDNLQHAMQTSLTPQTKSQEWEISIYEIKFKKRIGQGAAATTYLADWQTGGQKVAVKVAAITEFGLDGWRREVKALQRLHHPNVIRLLGSIEHPNPLTYCLVLEYCDAGDLNTALKYATPKNFFFLVSISIANAMAYLHSRFVIHRDLKPANVLCHGNVTTGNFTVKVTDFGVAADYFGLTVERGNMSGNTIDDVALRKNLTGETGTYRWMAPEVIRHEPYSTMADVYSFAVMLWQLLTHDEPFQDVDAVEAAKLVATEKIRPPIPDKAPESIVSLISTNWSDSPDERWKFEKIVESLETIKSSISTEEKVWLEEANGHPVYIYDEPDLDVNAQTSKLSMKQKRESTQNKASNLLSSFFSVQKKFGKGKGK